MSFLIEGTQKVAEGTKNLALAVPGLGKLVELNEDAELGKVFITTGYGPIGYRVAMSLLEAGYTNIRVGIPKGETIVSTDDTIGAKTEELLKAKGAECIEFEWTSEQDVTAALDGVTTVFCTIPRMEGWVDAFPDFLTACKKAKCEYFVKISFFHAGVKGDPYSSVPFVEMHGKCDDLVINSVFDSRIKYTILSPSHLMSDPLVYQGQWIREEKKFYTASYGMGVDYISPNDVADAALCCLLDIKEHANKSYTLTGGEPLYDEDVAKLLSDFIGSEVEHVDLGYHKYKKFMKATYMPEWLAKDAAALERIKASGSDEKKANYTTDLKKIIGKKPESFRSYLKGKAAMSLQENPSG